MAKAKLKFTCVNDGIIGQEFVSLLCNRYGGKMKQIDGYYICEDCLKPEAKFECRLCGEFNIKLEIVKKEKTAP